MSQPPRPKHPVDVLQSMLNAILIETGKALRSAGKGTGRPLNENPRFKMTIQGTYENFHQALDDLECDIIRAKSVLLRDLQELRAKRIALETPKPITYAVEEVAPKVEKAAFPNPIGAMQEKTQPKPKMETAVEVEMTKIPDKPAHTVPAQAMRSTPREVIPKLPAHLIPQQGSTPPKSSNESNGESHTGDLGINTQVTSATSAPATADLQNSSIDSLFDIAESESNNNISQVDFDSIDFSNTQTQSNDFDLSTFGNSKQDFSMADFHTSDTNTPNKTTISVQKKGDAPSQNTTSGGNLDLDLDLGMGGTDDNSFDDMFNFDGEMEHGDFDEAFFGMNN